MDNIHPRLKEIIDILNEWCQHNGVNYDIACDENDIQGIKLFQKNRNLLNDLFNHMEPYITSNNVHIEHQKVRGGTIIAFSLEAISESELGSIINNLGEEIEPMTFYDKITDAMERKPYQALISQTLPENEEQPRHPLRDDFLNSAIRIIEGDKEEHDSIKTKEAQSKNSGSTKPSTGASKGEPLRFEEKVNTTFGGKRQTKRSKFNMRLHEALDGIATPSDTQPKDLFTKFARALRVLGDQMGVGPLQDQLKEQGINWKKSDDGQSIILYIVNAQTKAPQPIARISSETLDSPNEFEEQLTNMLDFAKGDAPGAFKQKQQEIKDQEKTVRDIAKSIAPSDDNEVTRKMQTGSPEAATIAATPKI